MSANPALQVFFHLANRTDLHFFKGPFMSKNSFFYKDPFLGIFGADKIQAVIRNPKIIVRIRCLIEDFIED